MQGGRLWGSLVRPLRVAEVVEGVTGGGNVRMGSGGVS